MESPLRETNVISPATSIKKSHKSHEETNFQSDRGQHADTSSAEINSIQTVTPKECIDHLKFLSVLAELQHNIRNRDGLFGINHPGRLVTLLEDPVIKARVEEKRWQVYVSRAVDRFKEWWTSLPKYKKQPTVMSMKRFEMNPLTLENDLGIGLSKGELPPLGKLIVVLETCIELVMAKQFLYRCSHGLAFIHAQPSCISGRLFQTGKDEFVGDGISMGLDFTIHVRRRS
jgi:hypothetical protein